MRQSWSIPLLILATLMTAGCFDRRPPAAAGGIVSLTPAGTDLLVAMGLTDRIVGVSPYEANEALRLKLPKVGDYLRIDWERLAELRPALLVVQGNRDRLPPGTREKCKELGIRTMILQIDRMADIAVAVGQLGQATEQPALATKLVDDLRLRQSGFLPPAKTVPSLIVFSDTGTQVAGRSTFIDDALTLAGGKNVIEAGGYVTIDHEKLASLRPRTVFLVLPTADALTVDRAKASLTRAGLWTSSVVHAVTDADALMPSTATYRLAETMAKHLKAVQ